MNRLGLALSGGGFRATLYHLGVIRFLRDAQILPHVTHITAVSGGSILGAHLVQHWDKYCGSEDEFQDVADAIVRFVQLDVRNRIVRRFPLASAANSLMRFARMGSRRSLTRAGLLEQHYERYLYGDATLDELPGRPQLHIMATNLSEGCLCSFNRNGLLLQRRARGKRDYFERVDIGLATIPMAVAASSAFPGFFPPLELRAWDVGADEGDFKTQAFTDGGVYDNLGLRMFRYIDQLSIHDTVTLTKADFLDLDNTMAVLKSADSLPERTPLRRIHQMIYRTLPHDQRENVSTSSIIRGLREIIRAEELFRDPAFQNMELSDPAAQSLLKYSVESNRKPEFSTLLWLNRQILESALRQVVGKPCLRVNRCEFDSILVSDSGGKFKRTVDARAGGLIRTGLRASDILMDRVWQMELEAHEGSQGLVVMPITDVVEQSQDPHAQHPELQRQAARIRTDLDRFSDLEVSALVQHGYCIARKACRSNPELFRDGLPSGAAFDPLAPKGKQPLMAAGQRHETDINKARRLRESSLRRIWRTLFSLRDWTTYVWVPLLLLILFSVPYALYKSNERAMLNRTVLSAIANTSPLYGQIMDLTSSGTQPRFEPMPFKEVAELKPTDHSAFRFNSASRIFDLRNCFTRGDDESMAMDYTRIRARRVPLSGKDPHLRMQFETTYGDSSVSCENASLQPKLSRLKQPDGGYLWEIDLDFGQVPLDTDVDLLFRRDLGSSLIGVNEFGGQLDFSVRDRISVVQIWVLMPTDRSFESLEVVGHPIGSPDQAKFVVPDSLVELPYGSIAMFRLIDPDSNYSYQCRWRWVD